MALASIGQIDLLPQIFGKIHVADAVIEECAEGGRIFVPDLRELGWIVPEGEIKGAQSSILLELDRGEKQTISIALARNADKIIMDERLGRRLAEYLGLGVTGTLGVLAKARSVGLIRSFRSAAREMQQQGIYFNADLIDRLAYQLGELP